MAVDRRFLAVCFCGAAMLAACSTRPPEQTAARQATPPSQPAPAPMIPPLTLDGYKKEFARRVAYASPDIFDDPLPEMFKSIVVLDIAVDRRPADARRGTSLKRLQGPGEPRHGQRTSCGAVRRPRFRVTRARRFGKFPRNLPVPG